MTRDPRYDILFEPQRIGPLTARNRFYQVPHCNGMGYRDSSMLAAMRGVKAEGGWAVVSTEMVEIHHTADVSPYVELRLWSDQDIPALARIAGKVHAHGGLAAIELCHSGPGAANLWSREVSMGPMALPVFSSTNEPIQARAMDKDDICDLRRAHRAAALRAKTAGFDLIYVYAGHGIGVIELFLSRATNQRTDEYGGPLANRARLLKEIIEDTKDAVGAACAVPVRISLNQFQGADGLEPAEVHDAIGMVAELPDLWDLTLSDWSKDSRTSRFAEEGFEEEHIKGVKKLTTKPVVGVGRYTSPDAMVRVIKSGIMDFIGAARPSIADPFLPKKIEEGRLDDIRECIGCNICVTGDFSATPLRCTQNPSMGEEWRKGWHPEIIRKSASARSILIVGAGPAGLEAGRALGQRGYKVTIADRAAEAGGRVARECRLPGLAAWGRVRDWRLLQIGKMANVDLYLESEMTHDALIAFGADAIVLATGAAWRRDGVARHHLRPIPVTCPVLTPDDLMTGARPAGKRVLIYDDDHYYMGGVLAELLTKEGHAVTLVTPSFRVSSYTKATLEQAAIQTRLLNLGVAIRMNEALTRVDAGAAATACVFTGAARLVEADAVVMVTARLPRALPSPAGTAIGDALAPGTIAHAVYAGRRYAEEFDTPPRDFLDLPFRREVTGLSTEP